MTARYDLNTHGRPHRVQRAGPTLSILIMPAKPPAHKKSAYSLRTDRVAGMSAGTVRNAAGNR